MMNLKTDLKILVNFGYICTNCGMGWDGKYIDNLSDKSCPDCNGELEFRENIDEI